MSNIIDEVEGLFSPEVKAVEAFVSTVKTDVETWVKQEEALVVEEAKVAWAVIKPILTGIGPSQWAILQGLVQTAAKDAAAGDYTAIAGAVIAQATTAELAWVGQLGTEVLGVYAAVMAYKPKA